MNYREISSTGIKVPSIGLGTWSFGSDKWWGHQDDEKSRQALDAALKLGINLIDTAPVYGRGHSEELIGEFLLENKLREKVVLATKLGLSWQEKGPKIYHNLSRKRMFEECDLSRKRLQTDYFDLYQVHWPDPAVPIAETATVMHEFYRKKITKAVGVSNYSVAQMKEFMGYCPLHSLQPQYSMFCRNIEQEIVPFCRENNIAIFPYAPLFSGILTGKFFLDNVPVPNDINRQMKKSEFCEPRFSINKEFLTALRDIACRYEKTLSQLVLNWTLNRPGITAVLAGSRNAKQIKDNAGAGGWAMDGLDAAHITELIELRDKKCQC
jgi:aryl-alcohol dehydrogenase-like predicted oxidoreductase